MIVLPGFVTARSSLLRQAGVRLLIAVLVSALAAAAASVWVFRSADRKTAEAELAHAREFVARRLAQIDLHWEGDAFSFKTQIEFAHLTDHPDRMAASLMSFIAAQGDTVEFAIAEILDSRGRVRFRFPTPASAAEQPVGRVRWWRDPASKTVYRLLYQPVWLGPDGTGTLALYHAVDNQLLGEAAFPGTELHLVWDNALIASSLGERGVRTGRLLLAQGADPGQVEAIQWNGDAQGPQVIVQRTALAPLDPRTVLLPALLAALAGGVLAWLLLSAWIGATVRRLKAVESGLEQFSRDQLIVPAISERLDQVASEGNDEIASLSGNTLAMMRSVALARVEQANAQGALSELNANLEQRVTERTRELAMARDAALDAGRAKERFLANMSHELRTPMNGLLGALELLDGTPLATGQKHLLQTAAASGEALLAIINDVLDFSKITAGKLEIQNEPVALRQLVSSAVRLFSASAQRKGLQLGFDWDDRLPVSVVADQVRLRQVLLNLIGNAMKFTERGRIDVRVQAIAETEPASSATVRFEITDTGVGIDASDLELIFNPFVQADMSDQRRFGGTGLGLAISRRLVEAMGGTIEVASTVDRGSTFRFALPLPPAATPPTAPPGNELSSRVAAGPMRLGQITGRVLLVDDNVINRTLATMMLKQLGVAVVETENGQLACELLRSERFDAVLMDVLMPVMDGLAATREIRAREAREGSPRLPIIALTASALREDIEATVRAGVDAHVSKPFTLRHLADTLGRFLPVAAQ